MNYHFSKTINLNLAEAKEKVANALKAEGFGILTEINLQSTLKNKLGVDLNPYLILGACNPEIAYKAIQAEAHIGTMLPCNVILRETGEGETEVSAVDPVASMMAIQNDSLGGIAHEVRTKLERAITGL